MDSFDERAWQKFAKLFEKKWSSYDSKGELLELVGGDVTLAMVVSQVSTDPQKWLSKEIPALGNKTPIWCLNNKMNKELKNILMRFPW